MMRARLWREEPQYRICESSTLTLLVRSWYGLEAGAGSLIITTPTQALTIEWVNRVRGHADGFDLHMRKSMAAAEGFTELKMRI